MVSRDGSQTSSRQGVIFPWMPRVSPGEGQAPLVGAGVRCALRASGALRAVGAPQAGGAVRAGGALWVVGDPRDRA